jgi:hypothetical protein
MSDPSLLILYADNPAFAHVLRARASGTYDLEIIPYSQLPFDHNAQVYMWTPRWLIVGTKEATRVTVIYQRDLINRFVFEYNDEYLKDHIYSTNHNVFCMHFGHLDILGRVGISRIVHLSFDINNNRFHFSRFFISSSYMFVKKIVDVDINTVKIRGIKDGLSFIVTFDIHTGSVLNEVQVHTNHPTTAISVKGDSRVFSYMDPNTIETAISQYSDEKTIAKVSESLKQLFNRSVCVSTTIGFAVDNEIRIYDKENWEYISAVPLCVSSEVSCVVGLTK